MRSSANASAVTVVARRRWAACLLLLVAGTLTPGISAANAQEASSPTDQIRPVRPSGSSSTTDSTTVRPNQVEASPLVGKIRPRSESVKVFGLAYGDTLSHMSASRLAATLVWAHGLGVRWIRVDLSWPDIQSLGPAKFNWKPFDRIVTAAARYGLRILPTLAYTPHWARSPGCESQMCAPTNAASFASFARKAARRYHASGIHTWEIWNEENVPGFWKPSPDPAEFSRLVLAAAAAIRGVDPTARIVTGGLAATLTENGAIDPRSYLASLCTFGVNKVVNAIGYHPYTYPYLASDIEPWATAWNKIGETPVSLESVLAEFSTPSLPIWLTEYGAPTGGTGTAAADANRDETTDHVTQAWQAEIAIDALRTVVSSPDIGALFWYSDRDLAHRTGNEGFYGLRNAAGVPKLAFWALQRQLRHLNPRSSPQSQRSGRRSTPSAQSVVALHRYPTKP